MTKDEQIRKLADQNTLAMKRLDEAWAEIERLTEKVSFLHGELKATMTAEGVQNIVDQAEAQLAAKDVEIERLREALEKIALPQEVAEVRLDIYGGADWVDAMLIARAALEPSDE